MRDEKAYTYEGEKPFSTPQELTHAGIKELIADYVKAAKNAMAAGASQDVVRGHYQHGASSVSKASVDGFGLLST